ncbi:MAG: PIG-L family deacetylase [bacterium]|nr:PIG-L family deacetylase [bacterium]
MKILYIYPHPDDESFGPAHVMSKHRRQGHEVYLLTLTKGGATRQRFKYQYSVEKMGDVRYLEMLEVAKVLDLTEMTVLDLPDSGLKELDPRQIEQVVKEHIERIQPDVVATYAVHGISGFHDHLVTYAVVKRVFTELRETFDFLKRLAFVTITEESAKQSRHFHLNGSKPEEIDCVAEVEEQDIERCYQALDCYVTFQETIEKSGVKNHIGLQAVFEFFQEDFTPPLSDLFEKM